MSWPTMGRSEPCRARCVVICLVAMLACGLAACAADKEQPGPATTSDLVVDLQSLQPSEGGLSPSFHPADQSYAVNVGPNTSTVTLTAVTTDPRANLKINNQSATSGQPFGPIPLNGLTTTIPIVVEAFGVTKDYQVTVTRQTTPDLQNLTASAGALSPAFAPATLAYTVTTGFSTASTTITATVADNTATLTINGSPATSGVASSPIALNPGTTIIPVEVTASNGRKKTYQVTVVRGNTADLANLQTSAGPIAPVFSPSVQNYTASTGFTTTQATITVTPADSTATITINNQAAQSGQAAGPFNLNVGSNTFTIVATAGSAGSKTYTLVITRTPADTDANLTNLSVSAGALNPGFDPTITNYVVNAPNSTTSTTVTATVARSTSSLTINGNPAISGQAAGPFNLNVGANLVTVIVTAQSGATRQYQVTINRSGNGDANLANLSVSAGPLNPGFNPNTPAYSLTVPFTTTSTTVTATVSTSTSTVAINGSPATSGQAFGPISLPVGTTTIPVTVTAQDSSTKSYQVAITRQGPTPAVLTSLSVSAGPLNPVFGQNTTNYTVNVVNSVNSTTVTATVSAGLTLSINGSPASSGVAFGPISLPVGTTNISVKVTAQDGSSLTYTVAITRADIICSANLTGLAVGSNSVPGFAPNVISYAVAVSSSTTSVVVGATAAAPATVTINESSTNPRTITLGDPGTVTTVAIVVSCPAGSKRYTLTISRPLSSNATLASFRAFENTKLGTEIALTLSAPTFQCTVNGNCLYTGSTGATGVRFTATKSDINATLRILGPANALGLAVLYDTAGPGDPTAEATLSFQNVCGSTALTVRLQVTAQDGVTQRTTTITVTQDLCVVG